MKWKLTDTRTKRFDRQNVCSKCTLTHIIRNILQISNATRCFHSRGIRLVAASAKKTDMKLFIIISSGVEQRRRARNLSHEFQSLLEAHARRLSRSICRFSCGRILVFYLVIWTVRSSTREKKMCRRARLFTALDYHSAWEKKAFKQSTHMKRVYMAIWSKLNEWWSWALGKWTLQWRTFELNIAKNERTIRTTIINRARGKPFKCVTNMIYSDKCECVTTKWSLCCCCACMNELCAHLNIPWSQDQVYMSSMNESKCQTQKEK